MAVPKRKVSKARRDKRRSNVWKLDTPNLIACPHCHELIKPHTVCSACGFYDGKEVVKHEAEKATEA
jgi:large subunit ribosomal protein L32